MYRPTTSQPSLKQRVLALHYPLYLTLLASIGAIVGIRLLMEYSWRDSVLYGVTLVLSFWLGQVVVGLMNRKPTGSLD